MENIQFYLFKLFPTSKIDFLKWQKMDFFQKCFREIDLFDFTSFLGLDFFKFSGHHCVIFIDDFDKFLIVLQSENSKCHYENLLKSIPPLVTAPEKHLNL